MFDALDQTHDLVFRLRRVAPERDPKVRADRVLVREKALGEGAIDHHHVGAPLVIGIDKFPAAQDRNIHGIEVTGAHPAMLCAGDIARVHRRPARDKKFRPGVERTHRQGAGRA